MTPQEALVAIARERDIDALVAQPEMLRGHLMDYCRGGNRREFNLLVYACHSRVPQVLRAPSSSVLQADRIADLARRMVDDHDTSLEGARWAVGTWALALGVPTAPVTDLRPSDPVRPPVPKRVPDPAPVADAGRPALVVDAGAVWGAYATIGEAIRASVVPGSLITVKPGIYREALVIDRVVEIVGEGDRARIVVEATDTDALTVTADRAVVRNLTVRAVGSGATSGAVRIQRGRVVIEGYDLTSAIGAVVYITGRESNPVVRDCQIRNGKQVGVIVWDQGHGTIEQCVISGNRGYGVVIRTGGNPTVRNCEIRENRLGGVLVDQGLGAIEECVIAGNALAGVEIKTCGNPTVRDCQIRDGRSAGVLVYEEGQGMIDECVISGNAYAGVSIRTGGNPTVRDCKIRDGKQSGIYVGEQGQGTFTGNTLAGNAGGAWDIGSTTGRVTRTGNRPNV